LNVWAAQCSQEPVDILKEWQIFGEGNLQHQFFRAKECRSLKVAEVVEHEFGWQFTRPWKSPWTHYVCRPLGAMYVLTRDHELLIVSLSPSRSHLHL
jgi:hypothetical protein